MKMILQRPVFNEVDIKFNYNRVHPDQKIKFIGGLYYGKNDEETLFSFAAAKFQHLMMFE